jgi:hypothetical protein
LLFVAGADIFIHMLFSYKFKEQKPYLLEQSMVGVQSSPVSMKRFY